MKNIVPKSPRASRMLPILVMVPLCHVYAGLNISSPPMVEPFTGTPSTTNWAVNWKTLSVGTASTSSSTDLLDAAVISNTDASLVNTAIGTSGSLPPNANAIARWNSGAFIQTRPTGNDYTLLLVTMTNATGGDLSKVQVIYDYSKTHATDVDPAAEVIKGLRAYVSLTGTPGSWVLVPELSRDAAGSIEGPEVVTANIPLTSALPNGGTVYLLWADQNSAGGDSSYHIDNFRAGPGTESAIDAAVSNVVRNPGASLSDPADDTVTFTLKVNGSGAVSPAGFFISSPSPLIGMAGAYGVEKTFTDVPYSAFTNGHLPLVIADAATASTTTTASVLPNRVIGFNTLTNTPILSTGSLPNAWVIDETARTLTMNSGGGGSEKFVRSEVIDLTTLGAVQISAVVEAKDTTTGFEAADTFVAELIVDGATAAISLITPYDKDGSGKMNGGAADPAADEFNKDKLSDGPYDSSFPLSYALPASANSVQLVIRGVNDSGNETLVVKNITIETPTPQLQVIQGTKIPDNHGTSDPSDDTFTVQLTVNPFTTGASTGYNSSVAPASVLYSATNPVTFGPLPASGTQTITLTDKLNPAITTTIEVTPPATNPLYVVGQVNIGGVPRDLLSLSNVAPATEWVNDAALRTLVMTNGNGATDKVVQSEVIDLSGVGAVNFSAVLRAAETSTASNFERADRFKAELIIDGGTPINLISAYDTGNGLPATGAGGGANGAPDGYINGYDGVANGVDAVTGVTYLTAAEDYDAHIDRDEFNTVTPKQNFATQLDNSFPLTYAIPAGANSVQLKVYGANISGTETFTVSDVLFTTGETLVDTDTDGIPDAYEDANGLDRNSASDRDKDLDGDGRTNYQEYLAGTAANNAASVLKILDGTFNATTGALTLSWTSVQGKRYRAQYSADLQTWTNYGVGIVTGGAGSSTNVTIPGTGPVTGKGFIRVQVVP